MPEDPSEILNRLFNLTSTPEVPAGGASPTAEETYERAQKELDIEVHSFTSLDKSRDYVLKLLEILPDHKKTELAAKAVEQELSLQESIRKQSYSASEISTRLRRALTWFYAISTLVLLLLLFFMPSAAAWLKIPLNEELYRAVVDLTKISFMSGLATILFYYFKRK